jgi:hypothetical protein
MDITKEKIRKIILEELQGMLDEAYAIDTPETPEERAKIDAAWASAKESPPRSPEPKQASAMRKIAHTLLDTGLDPNDASVWEMVKDAAKRAGGVFPKAEGLQERYRETDAHAWDYQRGGPGSSTYPRGGYESRQAPTSYGGMGYDRAMRIVKKALIDGGGNPRNSKFYGGLASKLSSKSEEDLPHGYARRLAGYVMRHPDRTPPPGNLEGALGLK